DYWKVTELSNLCPQTLGVHVMRVHQFHYGLIGAALILFAFSSVSEARWFRGGGTYYYVPASPAGCAPTNQALSVPTGGAAAASSGATSYQVNKIPVPAKQPLP